MKTTSNTIVKNGMPFIIPVLRQVEPFMDQMIITVSEASEDDTRAALSDFRDEFIDKVILDTEYVKDSAELTTIRQEQLDKSDGDWILFLDADDWWSRDSLHQMQMFLHNDVDGYGINPYQLVDEKTYDDSWKYKFFTKWFRKQKGVHYEGDWPRDLIYKDNDILYWRKNTRVPRLPIRFFHLSNIMKWRFRNEAWAKEYESTVLSRKNLPEQELEEVKKIFSYLK